VRLSRLESFKAWVNGALAALRTTLTVALVAIGWLFQRGK
jgi:hypothetical protein